MIDDIQPATKCIRKKSFSKQASVAKHAGLGAWAWEVQEEQSGAALVDSRPRVGFSHPNMITLPHSSTGGRKAGMLGSQDIYGKGMGSRS